MIKNSKIEWGEPCITENKSISFEATLNDIPVTITIKTEEIEKILILLMKKVVQQ